LADGWSFVEELGTFETRKKKVPQGARMVCGEFTASMGLRPGATEEQLLKALVRHLGPYTETDEAIAQGISFLRRVGNGDFTQGTLEKSADYPWVPHKSYEYK
jgi:hypothetical protein